MFQPNSIIAGRYQVIRLVGQGGMSNLYLAYDRKYNNAVVVVKEMTAAYSDPKEQQMAVELFHREAKLLASLNHRHIPKVYDYFQFAGKYYLSMEFIDGEDLAQKLEATKGPLPEQQVLEWGEQIATVLFYLHKHDPPIVFRDVKPSNIMLCDQGVKLIDFGIARHFDQAKKGDTMRIGSPGYAPPEQYAAQTDPRSDIYALGVTLHHALTGRDPTATQTPFLVPPARNLNPALSEATAAMLARATQLDPNDRYQNILEMKNDIKHILSRGKQSTRVVGAPPPPPGPAVAPVGPTTVVASPSAPAPATPPQAPPAPASPTAAPNPATPVVAVAAAPQAKRTTRRRHVALLLVAAILLVVGGGGYLAGPEAVQAAIDRLKSYLATASQSHSTPEIRISEALRQAARTGNPQGLLALFGNGQLANLSRDKQELYRLNVLAAGVSTPQAPATIVHLLYPQDLSGGPSEDSLYHASARAVAAINGSGGMNKRLMIVLPEPYAAGKLDAAIEKLSLDATDGQRLLILDPNGESSKLRPEHKALLPFVVGPNDPGDGRWLAPLAQGKELSTLFSPGQTETKLLWAAQGDPPDGKAERVEFTGTAESLNRLLERSHAEQAVVVVEAKKIKGLEGLTREGRLLLLAIGPHELPAIGGDARAEALVLGSPLRVSGSAALVASPSSGLEPEQARLFDAIYLATLLDNQAYSGITVSQAAKGSRPGNSSREQTSGVAVRYRWSSDGWVPDLKQ